MELKAERASSVWLEGVIEVGRETRRYWVFLDMIPEGGSGLSVMLGKGVGEPEWLTGLVERRSAAR